MARMKVEGLRELEKMLLELPRATAKSTARRILKQAGQPIAEMGRDLIPEDEGFTKASYAVGRLSRAARRRHVKKSEVEIAVGPNSAGGLQTEFGNARQSAQPHLRPAWEANKREALRIVSEEFGAEIEKTVQRYRKRVAKG